MDRNLITYEKLKQIHKDKGYKWYTGVYNLNIGGIRSNDNTPNTFNDWGWCAYQTETGKGIVWVVKWTTDPGVYWLNHPMNVNGTFILIPGQYIDSHEDGLHNGKRALVQCGKLSGWRDNNKNDIIDIGGEVFSGVDYMVDIHVMGQILANIARWSAGCQGGSEEDIKYLLFLYDKMKQWVKREKISYTLLVENDFKG